MQAVLTDIPVLNRLAQQPLRGAFWQVTLLQQQAVCATLLPGGGLPEVEQHLLQCGQFGIAHRLEQRHQQHALQPIHGDLFQPRPAAASAVKQPASFTGRRS